MKLAVLVLCFAAGTLGYLINVPTAPATQRVAQMDWIRRQKVITSLFENFCEDSADDFITRSAQDFMTYTATDFVDPEVFARLKNLIGSGVMAKGIIFSEFNEDHFKELEVVRDVLYYARNFEVFFKGAAWARQNLNCGVFLDVFYSALIFRKDTEKLSLPAPYEILPNYFFIKEDIITGASLLTNITTAADNVREDGNSYVITSKYTTDFTEDVEPKLSYFHEDVGLNTYIFLNKLIGKECWSQNAYGEYLYHFMKQLVTRYNLERYSNALPEVQSINFDTPIYEMYDPMLMYSNGNNFDFRTKALNVASLDNIILLKNIEANINPFVTRMVQNGFDKTAILNNLVDVLVTGENSYESVAFMNLGKDVDSAKKSPSVLEHYMTLARDPLFWQINKKMVDIIDKAISALPTYTRNELYFPGVEVVNVEMKSMTTSFTMFETDVTEALKSPTSTGSFLVKMSQPRLSHGPFSMKLNISSVTAQKGYAKIYLGPRMLPGQMAENKNEFMLLDAFEINLKKGGNTVTRKSSDMKMYTDDFYSLKTLTKKIEDAEFGLNTLSFTEEKMHSGFPSRLLIPKGSVGGLPFQLFVFVAPLTKVSMTNTAATNEFNTAVLSPGYPLDLSIDDRQLFDLPNALVKDIVITHKDSSKVPSSGYGKGSYKQPYNENSQDLSQPWEQPQVGQQMLTSSYVPTTGGRTTFNKGGKSGRPEFTMKNKFDTQSTPKRFDYKSKVPERGSKTDFKNNANKMLDTTSTKPFDNVLNYVDNKDTYYIDDTYDNLGQFGKQNRPTNGFMIDPVYYDDKMMNHPSYIVTKSTIKNIDKTIDKTIDNPIKNVIKTIDKGIKNSLDSVKVIDKDMDLFGNDKVKEINIEKDHTTDNIVDPMNSNVNENVHKVITYHDTKDLVGDDKTITVDSKTLDDGTVSHIFGFDTIKEPVLKKTQTVYDYIVRAKDTDDDDDEKVYE